MVSNTHISSTIIFLMCILLINMSSIKKYMLVFYLYSTVKHHVVNYMTVAFKDNFDFL